MADLKISQLTASTTPLAGTEVLPIVQSSATVKVSVANLTSGRNVSLKEIAATVSGAGTALEGFNLTNGTVSAIYKLSGATYSYRGVGSNTLWIGNNNTGETIISNVGNGKVKIGTDAFSYFEVDSSANATFVSGNLIQGTAAKGVNFTANTPAAGMTSQLLNWYEEGTWTPSVTSSSGAITTLGTVTGKYTRIGRQVTVHFSIAITTNGTGAGSIVAAGLPFTISGVASGCGRENGSTGDMLNVTGANGSTTLGIVNYNNSYPGGNGYNLQGFATYTV